MTGIYRSPVGYRTGLVAIHQLLEVPETLWLRVLGKGKVQQRAIAELAALPIDDPLRSTGIELIYQLQANLVARQQRELNSEDRELMMAVAPLFQEKLAAAKLEGREQGIEQGRIQGQRSILENFLQVRLGELDPILAVLVNPVAAFSAAEFALLLVRLSDAEGMQPAKELLAEAILRQRLGEEIDRLIPPLLALSVAELEDLFRQWNEVSDGDLRLRLEPTA